MGKLSLKHERERERIKTEKGERKLGE